MAVTTLTQVAIGDTPESTYCDASDSGRKLLLPEDVRMPAVPPRVLLVDDNEAFGKIMLRAAEKLGVTLIYCKGLADLDQLQQWSFDVALVDYDLGELTGFELTQHLEKCSEGDIPVILVSQTKRPVNKNWPVTMREFVHKTLGPFAILEAAFEAFEIHRILEHMRTGKQTDARMRQSSMKRASKAKRRVMS